MKIDRERPFNDKTDAFDTNLQRTNGVWGLVIERQIIRVDSVYDDSVHGRVIQDEKVVDDNQTIEYNNAPDRTARVGWEDVSEYDRARVIPGSELELQWGRGPGFRFFRVIVRRSVFERK